MRVTAIFFPLLAFVEAKASTNTFRQDVVLHVEEKSRMLRVRESTVSALFSKVLPIVEYEKKHGKLPARRLEDGGNDYYANDDYYVNDDYIQNFNGYSIKYAMCQPIGHFSEEAIEYGEYSSIVVEDVVILHLCPQSSSKSSMMLGCAYNYGQYVIGLNDYLKIMFLYTEDKKQNLCNFCAACNGNRRMEDQNESENDQESEGSDEDEEESDEDEEESDEDEEQSDEDEEQSDEQNDQEEEQNNEEEEQEESEEEAQEQSGDDYYDSGDGDGDGDDGNDQAAAEYNDDNSGNVNYCTLYEDVCYEYSANNVCDDDDSVMSNNDYLDYLGCVQVQGQGNYGGSSMWIRPRCDTKRGTISMGIFYDPFCSQYVDSDMTARQFSGMNFDESVFEPFYESQYIDCTATGTPPLYNSNGYMCNKMYSESGKCDGNLPSNPYGDSSDQSTECAFIKSIASGTYDSKGGVTYGKADSFFEAVTEGQKIGLAGSIVLCVLLSVSACYLHHSITNLLIRSLSHSHLLPPSRHRSKSISKRRTRSRGRSSERGRLS